MSRRIACPDPKTRNQAVGCLLDWIGHWLQYRCLQRVRRLRVATPARPTTPPVGLAGCDPTRRPAGEFYLDQIPGDRRPQPFFQRASGAIAARPEGAFAGPGRFPDYRG